MTRLPTPVDQLAARLPEHGRIRFGVRSGKAMKSIDTFRFTSEDDKALAQIAEVYGGEVRPWQPTGHGGKNLGPSQFELISAAREISVILPPDPLGGTPIYEMWSGGGVSRRCDGVVCSVPEATADSVEMVERPCICLEQGAMACEVHVRLSVLLPEVRLAGTWRLETKSWNAAHELPGMVAAIQQMQTRGFTVGVLRLDKETKVVGGKTRHYVVPRLGMDSTPTEIAAGAASFGTLAAPPENRLALEAGEPDWEAQEIQRAATTGNTDDMPYVSGRPECTGIESTPTGVTVHYDDCPVHDDDDVADAEIVDDDKTRRADEAIADLASSANVAFDVMRDALDGKDNDSIIAAADKVAAGTHHMLVDDNGAHLIRNEPSNEAR